MSGSVFRVSLRVVAAAVAAGADAADGEKWHIFYH